MCFSSTCFARVSCCPFPLPLGVGGLAALCDCSTPWTFLLTLLLNNQISNVMSEIVLPGQQSIDLTMTLDGLQKSVYD